MGFSVVRVGPENYGRFRDMVFWRENGFERAPSVCVPRKEALQALEGGSLRVYAAQCEGRFVGWIALVRMPKLSRFEGPGYIYVDELWVQEDFRRRGIGAALLKTADDWAGEAGDIGVRLYVNTQTPGARRLYEKCGFAAQGTAEFMEKERAAR